MYLQREEVLLIHYYNVVPGQITRPKRNQNVNTHTIDMKCRIPDCKVEDIMEYVDEGID